MKKSFVFGAASIAVLATLTSCSFGGGGNNAELQEKENTVSEATDLYAAFRPDSVSETAWNTYEFSYLDKENKGYYVTSSDSSLTIVADKGYKDFLGISLIEGESYNYVELLYSNGAIYQADTMENHSEYWEILNTMSLARSYFEHSSFLGKAVLETDPLMSMYIGFPEKFTVDTENKIIDASFTNYGLHLDNTAKESYLLFDNGNFKFYPMNISGITANGNTSALTSIKAENKSYLASSNYIGGISDDLVKVFALVNNQSLTESAIYYEIEDDEEKTSKNMTIIYDDNKRQIKNNYYNTYSYEILEDKVLVGLTDSEYTIALATSYDTYLKNTFYIDKIFEEIKNQKNYYVSNGDLYVKVNAPEDVSCETLAEQSFKIEKDSNSILLTGDTIRYKFYFYSNTETVDCPEETDLSTFLASPAAKRIWITDSNGEWLFMKDGAEYIYADIIKTPDSSSSDTYDLYTYYDEDGELEKIGIKDSVASPILCYSTKIKNLSEYGVTFDYKELLNASNYTPDKNHYNVKFSSNGKEYTGTVEACPGIVYSSKTIILKYEINIDGKTVEFELLPYRYANDPEVPDVDYTLYDTESFKTHLSDACKIDSVTYNGNIEEFEHNNYTYQKNTENGTYVEIYGKTYLTITEEQYEAAKAQYTSTSKASVLELLTDVTVDGIYLVNNQLGYYFTKADTAYYLSFGTDSVSIYTVSDNKYIYCYFNEQYLSVTDYSKSTLLSEGDFKKIVDGKKFTFENDDYTFYPNGAVSKTDNKKYYYEDSKWYTYTLDTETFYYEKTEVTDEDLLDDFTPLTVLYEKIALYGTGTETSCSLTSYGMLYYEWIDDECILSFSYDTDEKEYTIYRATVSNGSIQYVFSEGDALEAQSFARNELAQYLNKMEYYNNYMIYATSYVKMTSDEATAIGQATSDYRVTKNTVYQYVTESYTCTGQEEENSSNEEYITLVDGTYYVYLYQDGTWYYGPASPQSKAEAAMTPYTSALLANIFEYDAYELVTGTDNVYTRKESFDLALTGNNEIELYDTTLTLNTDGTCEVVINGYIIMNGVKTTYPVKYTYKFYNVNSTAIETPTTYTKTSAIRLS